MTAPEVLGTVERFDGHVFAVRTDSLRFGDEPPTSRDVVRHPGAVGVVALDDRNRVMLISQYRHPVGRKLLELPAGLLDKAGEPASLTAARELGEEVGLAARQWHLLLDINTSPGMTDEAIRLFLARNITAAADTGFVREAEEADLEPRWVPLAEALELVDRGDITNAMCVLGLFAAARAAANDFAGLRPPDSPWPDRSAHSG